MFDIASGRGYASVAGQAKVPHELSRILHDALAARDRGLTGDDLDAAVAALRTRIDTFCARRPAHQPNRKLVAHIAREKDHLLTFLTTLEVAATNWRAAQAIRPMVVNRKNWGGNKTARGAHTTTVLGSILRTCTNTATTRSPCWPRSNATAPSRPTLICTRATPASTRTSATAPPQPRDPQARP
ncbi:MAG TPA: transposase, partial [Egibacteraceae bacterium]|nr:transposase [Egibacteraceae bacterium]